MAFKKLEKPKQVKATKIEKGTTLVGYLTSVRNIEQQDGSISHVYVLRGKVSNEKSEFFGNSVIDRTLLNEDGEIDYQYKDCLIQVQGGDLLPVEGKPHMNYQDVDISVDQSDKHNPKKN